MKEWHRPGRIGRGGGPKVAGWRCPLGLALALALLFLAIPAAATPTAERWAALADTVFQNYGREQGLPHPVPISLAQDADGFLWVGTQGGLARWDGYRFRSYRADPADPGSLPEAWIERLHRDPQGRLWVGTSAGGLALYDRAEDRFRRFPLGAPGERRRHIGGIADADAGRLWIGQDDRLYLFDPATGAATEFGHESQDPASLPDGQIAALLRDHAGRLWIGTTAGLARRDADAAGFTPIDFTAPGAGTVGVAALYEDADGALWIGTNRHGVYRLDAGGSRAIAETGPGESSLETDWVSAICGAGAHEIWLGTRGDGIVAVDTISLQTRRIRHDRTLPNSLAHDDIWTMLQDDAGSLWVGGTGGLSYRPKDLGVVTTVLGASSRPNAVSGADVYALLPTADGRVWLGFMGGGIDIVDPGGGRVAQLLPDPARPDSALPPDVVTAMAQAPGGDVYIGTLRGLYRADPAGRSVTRMAIAGLDPAAKISVLLADGDLLWVGGFDDGLWAIRPGSDGKPVFGRAEAARLTGPGIRSLLRGRGQDLWVGTRTGLNRLDLASGAVETIQADPADPAALSSRFVTALALDRQGRPWVGTFGAGIAVMTGRASDGRPLFRRLGPEAGLPHVNIDMLLPGGDGQIWAGTDDGLAVIDPASFAIRGLRRAEGSVLVDYFTNAGAVDAQGEALFGAKGGFTVVGPGRLEVWRYQPPIVISDLRIGGVPVPAGRFTGSGEQVQIKAGRNGFAVEFSALDFTAPERNHYAYRLDGFDSDWIQTDATRRLASYTNLPPGDYTLQLRGSNRDGVWAARDLALPIHVRPAWYQTLWFRLAAGLSGLALVTGIVQSRTAYLRHRQRELERQIAERTADLSAANVRLFELATTDPLSGCANRRHFIERAEELMAMSQRHKSPLTLLVLDLDQFKVLNDTHGHPAGDAVLRMMGQVCQQEIRGTDLLGRLGGEEFGILMPHTAAAGAALLAERLRVAIEATETMAARETLRLTASFGLAEKRPGESFDALYVRADAALYMAKTNGRNRVVLDAAE